MKLNPHLALANLVGLSLAGVAYVLAHSSCLGLPEWVTPILLTAQLALNAVAPSLVARPEPKDPFGPPA